MSPMPGGLHVVVHEEVGLGQREDRGGRNVDDVRHLAVRGLGRDGLVKLGAAALVGPLDRHAGVGIFEFLDLGLEEVAEVVLQALGLERDLAFDLEVSIVESSMLPAGTSQETSGAGMEPEADPPPPLPEPPPSQAARPRVLNMARATMPAAIFFFNMRNLHWSVLVGRSMGSSH